MSKTQRDGSVLITGTSSGIGKETAHHFRDPDAHLYNIAGKLLYGGLRDWLIIGKLVHTGQIQYLG